MSQHAAAGLQADAQGFLPPSAGRAGAAPCLSAPEEEGYCEEYETEAEAELTRLDSGQN